MCGWVRCARVPRGIYVCITSISGERVSVHCEKKGLRSAAERRSGEKENKVEDARVAARCARVAHARRRVARRYRYGARAKWGGAKRTERVSHGVSFCVADAFILDLAAHVVCCERFRFHTIHSMSEIPVRTLLRERPS